MIEFPMTVGAERDQVGDVVDGGDGSFRREGFNRLDVADFDVLVITTDAADTGLAGLSEDLAGDGAHLGADLVFGFALNIS